jgi:rod shape-determining protein MreC
LNEPKKRKIVAGVAIAFLLILIVSTFGGGGEISPIESFAGRNLTFVQRGLTVGADFFGNIINPVLNIWRLDKTNKELQLENQELRRKFIDASLSQKELKDLNDMRDALNYAEKEGYDFLTCDVVAKDPGTWFNMFIINKGMDDGVHAEQAVINGSGLIGIVYEVGKDWAKVVAIIDNKSSVSFKLLDDKEFAIGIVEGGTERGLSGYLFDPKAEVSTGQEIVTSGLGIYPEGLLIGTVSDVIIEKNELLKKIKVEQVVDFKTINRVMVILPAEGVE